MRTTLDNIEPREECCTVKRARDLTRAAADSIRKLALRDHGRHLVAIRFRTRADDLVEVERLARHDHVAIELRRGKLQIERTRCMLPIRRVLRLEEAEHIININITNARGRSAR